MKPSVGRIVHFNSLDGPMAAIITRVHSKTHVNLAVFYDDPDGESRTTFPKSVAYGEGRNEWAWPQEPPPPLPPGWEWVLKPANGMDLWEPEKV